MTYESQRLTEGDQERLVRARDDLMALALDCEVHAVRAAARAGLALIEQALNGQDLSYDLFSRMRAGPPS